MCPRDLPEVPLQDSILRAGHVRTSAQPTSFQPVTFGAGFDGIGTSPSACSDKRPGVANVPDLYRKPVLAFSRSRRRVACRLGQECKDIVARRNASIRPGRRRSRYATARSRPCPRIVREAAPTGKASSDRSCGQPELIVAAAAGPVTAMATLRCEMPTAECSAVTLAQSASGSFAGLVDDQPFVGAEPQSACGRPSRPRSSACFGKVTPSAFDSAATEASGARNDIRSAGGSTASLTPWRKAPDRRAPGDVRPTARQLQFSSRPP